MSIAVELDGVREQVARFGPSPYVLTVSADARPHAVSINVLWDGDVLVASVGRKTVTNAGANNSVSLLWPPVENGGYSFIVDGVASVTPGDDGGMMRFEPKKAVLHRNAVAPSDATSGCGNDCVPIFAQAK